MEIIIPEKQRALANLVHEKAIELHESGVFEEASELEEARKKGFLFKVYPKAKRGEAFMHRRDLLQLMAHAGITGVNEEKIRIHLKGKVVQYYLNTTNGNYLVKSEKIGDTANWSYERIKSAPKIY